MKDMTAVLGAYDYIPGIILQHADGTLIGASIDLFVVAECDFGG
jgi:hypothetical protein